MRNALIFLLMLMTCRFAMADSVVVAEGGKITGSISEIRLHVGEERVSFSRGKIKSVEFGDKTTIVTTDDSFSGRLDSVTISTASGGRVISISGGSVKSIRFDSSDTSGADESAQDKPSEPAPLKLAAELRDEYLKKAAQMTAQEYTAVKKNLADEWDAACLEYDAARKEYKRQTGRVAGAKPPEGFSSKGIGIGLNKGSNVTPVAGPIAEAYKQLQAAQKNRDEVAAKIRQAQAEIRNRDNIRRDRVKNYYYAIGKQIKEGNDISSDAMVKIYEKALDRSSTKDK